MGHPGPSVQETDIQVRTQHVELGCGQIHGSGLSTWSWGVDRYMGQDSAHGLECKQIHGSGLSTWAGVWTDTWVRTQHMGWSVDRYMGQDSAHGLGWGQIHGSGLSTWAGVWTDTWVRTQHMGWGVDRFGIQWMCLLISLAKCKCPLRSVWHFVPQPVCVWAYVRRSTYFCV